MAGIGLLALALFMAGCAGKEPLAFLKPKPVAAKAGTASAETGKVETKPLSEPKKPELKKDAPAKPQLNKVEQQKTAPSSAEHLATAPLKPSDQLGPGFWIQLAVHFKEEGGKAAWKKLSRRHRRVLGGESHAIKRVDLGERGRYYRVLVGPYAAPGPARAKCSRLRQAKVACFLITQKGRVRGARVAGAGKTIAPKPPATTHPAAAIKPRNPAAPRKAGITATPAFVKPAPRPHSGSVKKKSNAPRPGKKRAIDLPFQRKDSIPGATK